VEPVLLAIAAIVLALVFLRGDGEDIVLLAVVVIAMALLFRHLEDRGRRPPGPPPGTPPYPPGAPPGGMPRPPYPGYRPPPSHAPPQSRAEPAAGQTTALTRPLPVWDDVPPPSVASPGGAPGPYGPLPPLPPPPPLLEPPLMPPPAPAPPAPRRRRREPSILGALTVSILLVALGVLATVDAAAAVDISARWYLALALGVIGVGLLVGTWLGRARWLIPLGVIATVGLLVVGAADVTFRGGAGDRLYQPATVDAIEPRYELGAGQIRLDMSDVDFTGRAAATTVELGVGEARITVPREVDVEIQVDVGLGDVEVLGRQDDDGVDVRMTVSDDGPDGSGGGELRLAVDVALGAVVVHRAAA
jgi:Cell wall-active antibiotics response 4TMS YvqF